MESGKFSKEITAIQLKRIELKMTGSKKNGIIKPLQQTEKISGSNAAYNWLRKMITFDIG